MSFDLTARELKSTVALSVDQRLEYFIRRVRESEQIWTLADGEALLVLGGEDHPQFVAVWPHPDYALSWFEDSGIDEADLVAMDLQDWLEDTLAELADAEIAIDVFPTAEADGLIISALNLRSQLDSDDSQA